MNTKNETRGVVTSMTLTTTYPDGSTKQLVIENPDNNLQAIIFDEETAQKMSENEQLSPNIVKEWVDEEIWKKRNTFILKAKTVTSSKRTSPNILDVYGVCALCKCDSCQDVIVM